jgi:hypothetical protein
MKILAPLLLLGTLLTPGSPGNPYIVKETPTGQTKIKTRFYEPTPEGFNLLQPGSPSNPYIIERTPAGELEIKTRFFDFERRSR